MALKSDKFEMQSILLKRNPVEETVPVPEETLARLNWRRAVSSQSVEDTELHELILELQRDDATHTWHYLSTGGSENLSKRLSEFENERRESIILYYYGEDLEGKRHLFGASAIAERVSRDFPYSGYPVIGRMYVSKQYREFKLGSLMALYKVLFCINLFGEKLMGVHTGTSSPQIFTLLQRGDFFGEKFRYVGNKKLEGNDEDLVKAFFLPGKKFIEAIVAFKEILIAKSNVENELCILLQSFLENQLDETFFYRLKKLTSDFEKEVGFSPKSNIFFQQLITLLASIPVIE